MKILVIGASGTIGSAIVNELRNGNHEVLEASRSSDVQIDITESASILNALEKVGPLDAIICASGNAAFGPLQELTDEQFEMSLKSKVMGQVNVVRLGMNFAPRITITSGILSRSPWPGTSALALANGALESFVKAAALDLPDSKINCVAPPLIRETAERMGMGPRGIPAAEIAQLYRKVIESDDSGQTFLME